MNGLEALVDDALRDPLATARAHARSGGRVIGYVGAEIPIELIVASDAFALRLPSFAHGGSVLADRYLESSFGPEARSIAEQYLRGDLDFLDALILPRSNDGAQRLYYYLSELRTRGLVKGPTPLIFDLAKIPRATSVDHSRAATERLAKEIGVDESRLASAIGQRNRRRELCATAAALRASASRSGAAGSGPAGLLGSLMERIFRAADVCHADVFDAALEQWLRRTESRSARADSGPRLVLTGSAPPDERLHRAVEAGGGNVVAETGDHAACGAVLPLIAADGAFAAIADHYQTLPCGPRAFMDRAAATRHLAEAAGADGVIIWLIEEEEALVWDLPAQTAALAAAGIPTLALTRRCWEASDGALVEITSFSRNLRDPT